MRELITEKDMLHSRVIFKKHIAKTNNKKNPVLKKIMEIRKFKKSMTIKKKENNTDEIAFLLSEVFFHIFKTIIAKKYKE